MINLLTFKSNKIYSKIFTALIITIVLSIILTSSILYINFEGITQYHIYSSEKSSLSQSSYSAEFLSEFAKSVVMQLYYDKSVSKLRFYSEVDVNDYYDAKYKINSYVSLSDFIRSICVYNRQSNTFYSFSKEMGYSISKSDSFYDTGAVDIVKELQSYPTMVPIPRKYPIISSGSTIGYSNVYSIVFYEPQSSKGFPDSAVILNIPETWMRKTIDKLYSNPDRNTFIINYAGETIFSNTRYEMLSYVGDNKFIEKILRSPKSSGYFVDTVNGTKSLIIHAPYDTFGWVYIRIIPYGSIMEKVNHMRSLTLIIAGILLCLGLIVSLLYSRKLYRPIDDVMTKLKTLESERRNNYYKLKQDTLKSIILGESLYIPGKSDSEFSKYEISLNPVGSFVILLLKIDNYLQVCEQNSLKDRNLLKFGICNITQEIISSAYVCECVDMGENEVAVMVNIPENHMDHYKAVLADKLAHIQEQVKNCLNIPFSGIVSHIGNHMDNIPYLYNEAVNTCHYRIYHGHGCVIFAEDTGNPKKDNLSYALNKEKLFIEAIVSGKITEARDIYNEMIDDIAFNSEAFFRLIITHIFFSAKTAVEIIEKNGGIVFDRDFNDFIAKLNKLETLQEINAHFNGLFDAIEEGLEERKNSKYDELINKIYNKIHAEFSDPNLTLNSIAEYVGMCPAYVSKLFKQSSAKSIVDYINEVKMLKAKELLLSTECTITEIVQKTGFTNNQYFHKVFKKTFGVTPNEFRKL